MSSSQLERLKAIRFKCVELLEMARARTPGDWRVFSTEDPYPGIDAGKTSIIKYGELDEGDGVQTGLVDANFIASCAGPAEAGWRATIASLDAYFAFEGIDLSPCNGGSCAVATTAEEQLEAVMGFQIQGILNAWEGIVL